MALGCPAEAGLASGLEERLAAFAELAATAIANAEAREELRSVADEQAALRRVATLVARATPAQALFAAVTEEAGRLLSVDVAALARFGTDTETPVAGWSKTGAVGELGKPAGWAATTWPRWCSRRAARRGSTTRSRRRVRWRPPPASGACAHASACRSPSRASCGA